MTKWNMRIAIVTLGCMLACRNAEVPGELTFPKSAAGGTTGGGAGINVNPSSGLTTTEAGGSATFAVNLLSMPTSNVTVTIGTNDTTEGWVARTGGVCDTSVTAASGSCTLTFTPATWANAQNVRVIGQDDSLDDGNVGYTLTLTASSADPNYSAAVTATANLTNTDDDTAGFTATPTTGLMTRQDGLTMTIQVKLAAQPTANVTFTLISNDTNKGQITTPAGGSFTFTNANWNTNQNLIVTGQAATTGAYKIALSGGVTSSDGAFAALANFYGTGLDVTNFTTATKRIFVTNSTYNGNLGGVAGADTKCNADANKPVGGSTYKAIIIDGTNRRACNSTSFCTTTAGNNINWAMTANTPYVRPDGTTIKTTNGGGIFVFPLTNAIAATSGEVLTGIWDNWTISNMRECNLWTDGTSGSIVNFSVRNATDDQAIYATNDFCNVVRALYCAEQ